MIDIYSVSLVASQSVDGPYVRAQLGLSQDHRTTKIALEWQLPTRINADGNAGEWLYAVLSRLVQDYDEHMVTSAEYAKVAPEGSTTNA